MESTGAMFQRVFSRIGSTRTELTRLPDAAADMLHDTAAAHGAAVARA